MDALKLCTPHYVRCIKPNDTKAAREFDDRRVLHQIKYLGLLENIRVRRAGYAYRQTHDKFLERFFLLSPRTGYAGESIWPDGRDAKDGCKAILEDVGLAKDEWQLGVTKTFIRKPETLWALEHLRDRYWHNMAARIQRSYRAYWRYKNECATRVQRLFRDWRAVKVYVQLREEGHRLLGGRKERRRMSLLSLRRFRGDYLDAANNRSLRAACSTLANEGQIVFSARGQVLQHRFMRASKLVPRVFVLSGQALYTVEEIVGKPAKLERRLALGSIGSLSLSPYQDDFLVVHAPADGDIVACLAFKTELATHLFSFKQGSLALLINAKVEYSRKPGKKDTLTFVKDEALKSAALRKSIVAVPTGMPPNSGWHQCL